MAGLAAKLERRGVSPDERARTLETLDRAGYVDDAALRGGPRGRSSQDAATATKRSASTSNGTVWPATRRRRVARFEPESARARRLVARIGRPTGPPAASPRRASRPTPSRPPSPSRTFSARTASLEGWPFSGSGLVSAQRPACSPRVRRRQRARARISRRWPRPPTPSIRCTTSASRSAGRRASRWSPMSARHRGSSASRPRRRTDRSPDGDRVHHTVHPGRRLHAARTSWASRPRTP